MAIKAFVGSFSVATRINVVAPNADKIHFWSPKDYADYCRSMYQSYFPVSFDPPSGVHAVIPICPTVRVRSG
jgi:hypothetical protein